MTQAEEQIPGRGCEAQNIRAVGGGPTAVERPAVGIGQAAILMQGPARYVLPIHRHGVARMVDVERWRASRLYHRDECPETTRERIIAAGHGSAGIVLADGAADRINPARARATAAGYFVPINRVGLR